MKHLFQRSGYTLVSDRYCEQQNDSNLLITVWKARDLYALQLSQNTNTLGTLSQLNYGVAVDAQLQTKLSKSIFLKTKTEIFSDLLRGC